MLSSRTLLTITLAFSCTYAMAGPSELGRDYRILRSNYTMLEAIKERCPNSPTAEVVDRQSVHAQMQEKVGADQFARIFIAINKSDLKKNAIATIDDLFDNLSGCDDPKLGAAIGRIEQAHNQAYERFSAEPSLVQAKPVPVPLRRAE